MFLGVIKLKNIIVDENACIGCGACISIDPEHFTFSDEGLSEVISNENLETEDLQNAIESCPTNAICTNDNANNENCHCENCNCKDCECSEEECNCESCN